MDQEHLIAYSIGYCLNDLDTSISEASAQKYLKLDLYQKKLADLLKLEMGKYISINKCNHYWMLPSPRSKKSLGKCSKCQGTKEFMNIQLSELENKSANWRITSVRQKGD